MAKRKTRGTSKASGSDQAATSSGVDALLLAALERGDSSMETGRYLVTYKEGAGPEGVKSLKARGLRVADARDFKDSAVGVEDVGDADALNFPAIGGHQPEAEAQGGLYVASLNHALWLHCPLRADEWLHFDSVSPAAGSGRGLSIARVHDRQGRLVASATQECLMAPRER